MQSTSWQMWWAKSRGAFGTESWLQATPGKYGYLLVERNPFHPSYPSIPPPALNFHRIIGYFVLEETLKVI